MKNYVAPCLAHFDPSKKIIVSADASSYGLDSTLFQVNDENDKELVAYASRTLSFTEVRYAQIEREALSLTWAYDKFSNSISGILVVLQLILNHFCRTCKQKIWISSSTILNPLNGI